MTAKDLQEVSDLRGLLKLAVLALGLAVTAMCGVAAGHAYPLLFAAFAVAVAVWTQTALLEEVHDGVHRLIFRSPRLNDFVSGVYASLLGVSFASYRARHLDHHRYFGIPRDPDWPAYAYRPRTAKTWAFYFVEKFLGVEAVRGTLQGVMERRGGPTNLQHPLGSAGVHVVLLGLFAAVANPFWYFVGWFLPLLTLTHGIVKLRTLMEHWGGVEPDKGEEARGTLWNLTGTVQRNLFAAQFGYNLHAWHHVYPSVPNYRLGQIDRGVAAGTLEPRQEVLSTSYLRRLAQVLSREGG